MKQCPQCKRQYSDITLRFCLEDGERLTKPFDAEATVIGTGPWTRDSFRRKLDIRSWGYWTRGEKLTFLGVVAAAIGLIMAAIAWRVPQQPVPVYQVQSEECVLYNDVPTESTVNVRTGCDKNSCDDNAKLIIGSYPNGTKVQRKETLVKSKKFNWIQVVILDRGQTVWVADNKVSCKKVN